MQRLFFVSLLAVYASTPTSAWNFINRSQYCVAACALALNKVTFHLTHKGTKKTEADLCSGLYVQSLFDCSAIYCSDKEIKDGLKEQNSTCVEMAGFPLPDYDAATEHMTLEALANVTRVSKKSATADNYTHAVVPDDTFYHNAQRTIADQNNTMRFTWAFGWSLYGFWTIVLGLGVIHRATSRARTPSTQNISSLPRAESASPRNKRSRIGQLSSRVECDLLLPYLFGDGSSNAFLGGTIPTRIETLVIVLYAVVNFIFLFPGYHSFSGNINRPLPVVQISRYVGNRFGVLALSNLPIIWVFGARNNPFTWLTGWPFATFNLFHRWAARLATIEAIAHGICYSIAYAYQGIYYDNWLARWFFCGVISVAAMAFLLVLSHHWIRKIYYDAFLAIHISLALAVLVCVYFHVENMDDPSFFAFIWTCVAMWSFDRALRLGRVLYHSLLPNAKGIKALASYVPESDIIRLDVSKFFPRGEPSAVGAYYYVYEPGRIRGYESHPFTLCSWNRTSSGSNVMRTPTTSVGKEFQIAATDVEDGSPPSPAPSTSQETSHSFLIQPQHGFTQELRQKISSQEEIKAYPLTVLLEGPYGEQFPLERHSDVLMIIGGSGITAAVSRAYDLLSKSNARLHIVWAVRNKALVHTVCDHEFNSLLGHENVRLDVYLTKDTADPEKVFRHGVQLYEGRPVIESLLAEAIAQSSSSVGVFCCGPTRMGATCRVEIAKLMRSQQADVKFYEERFGW